MDIKSGLLALLTGLAAAQVATQIPPEEVAKAYRYELLLEPLEETKLPPPPPDGHMVRKAFLEKQGIIDLKPASDASGKVRPSAFLLYTEGPMPTSDIQEILKTIGLRAARIDLVSSPEKPQKP